MNKLFSRNQFFVKEHVGFLKAANQYDVFDLETREPLLECREPNLGVWTKIFRFTRYKTLTPFEVVISTPSQEKLLVVKRPFTLFRSYVSVFDEKDVLIGTFRQRFMTLGGKFEILDPSGNPICLLKGKWTSWEFTFLQGDTQIAKVTKKWAGIGKELFTTADNYALIIENHVPANDPLRQLIIASVVTIDMVLKEN